MLPVRAPELKRWRDRTSSVTTRAHKGSEDWRHVYTGDDERLLNYHAAGGSGGFAYTIRGLDGKVLRETDPGTVFTDFVYGASLLAKYSQAGARTDFHVDHLGTPRYAVNGTGAITRTFGNATTGSAGTQPAGLLVWRSNITGALIVGYSYEAYTSDLGKAGASSWGWTWGSGLSINAGIGPSGSIVPPEGTKVCE
jgi:hypothetical protein